jgi:hypothetical protein
MEMWLRLAAHASVGFVKALQAVYRRHAGNMSLSYLTKGWLPDLEQREAALECFFRTCGHMLPHSGRLRGTLLHTLALEAVGRASSAFNDCEMTVCSELAAFAVRVSPRVTKSLPWVKLGCKRRMGSRIWKALQSVAATIPESPHVHDGANSGESFGKASTRGRH